jgi:hypothetical protein
VIFETPARRSAEPATGLAAAGVELGALPRTPINMDNAAPDRVQLPAKRKLLQVLGPGPITGAADDDPSGIATYSQVSARA